MVFSQYPNVDRHLSLALSVKSIKDTIVPEELFHVELYLANFTCLYIFWESNPKPNFDDRSKLLKIARSDVQKIIADINERRSLKIFGPSKYDLANYYGYHVLICLEKVLNGRIGELMGPYQVTCYDPEMNFYASEISKSDLQDHSKFSRSNSISPLILYQNIYSTRLGGPLITWIDPKWIPLWPRSITLGTLEQFRRSWLILSRTRSQTSWTADLSKKLSEKRYY